MDVYKIVNATQLDADLESLANSLRAKRNENSSVEYEFPETYVDAIADLYYDDSPNTANDLTVSGKTVTVKEGYYPTAVSKSVADGSISGKTTELMVDPGALSFNKSTGNITIAATTGVNKDVVVNVTAGYQGANSNKIISNAAKVIVNSKTYSGAIPVQTSSAISQTANADGTYSVTIPEGYYSGYTITVGTPTTSS